VEEGEKKPKKKTKKQKPTQLRSLSHKLLQTQATDYLQRNKHD
jgi:hypothetical protein